MILGFVVGLIVAWGIVAYPIYNLLKKVEKYEDFFGELVDQLQKVIAHMRFVDIRGAFEADDEVGTAFRAILQSIETLEPFVISAEESNEETQN